MMSKYNPAVDAPKNQTELAVCVDYYLAKEKEKAGADLSYQPQNKKQLEQLYSVFLEEVVQEPLPTTAELFAQLRSIREVKFREYDEAVSQLERRARIGENVASQLAAWDAYAIALCELPEQSGAPWDGGMSETPWPVKP